MSTAILEPGQPLPDEKRVRNILGVVRRQIGHLNRMVGDLLDDYRVESGNLELRPQEMDARRIVEEAFECHVSSVHQLAMELPGTAVLMRCDAGRMGQVLNNLLSNAIKYSPEGGSVMIRLAQTESEAVIEVTDCGIGIPQHDVQHIFEPFRRAGVASQDIPGIGLGLHVARRIVEAHDGRIEVESRVGEGTSFKVWIPCTASSAQSRTVGQEHMA